MLVEKVKRRYSDPMNLPVFLLVSLAPLCLWVLYVSLSRTMSPLAALAGIFWGLSAVACASVIQVVLDPITRNLSGMESILFSAFIEAALIEELCKLAAAGLYCKTAGRKGFGGNVLDRRGILTRAVLIGITFAVFENLMYFIRSPGSLFFRTLVSLPVHVFACILAADWLLARIGKNGTMRKRKHANEYGAERTGFDAADSSSGNRLRRNSAGLLAVVAAVFFHGGFNACMTLGGSALVAGLILVLVLAVCALVIWNRMEPESV